jgi:prepilin peptidase CpaA
MAWGALTLSGGGQMNSIALQGAGLIFAAALMVAAISDWSHRLIPNGVPAAMIAAFPVAAWAAGLGLTETALHLAAAAAALIVAAGLFAVRAWGGGDAKLAAAALLWIGFAGAPRFTLVMALAGGLLALALLIAAGRRAKVPYGIAIAVAGLDWWFAAIASRGMS